jgi:polyisoprenoid-binding protein YceI
MTDTDTTSGASTALPLAPGRWTFDGLHSAVYYAVRHLGLTMSRGRFTDIDASLVVGETIDDITVEASVGLASLDSGNADRDAHMLSEDFLDAAAHPTMTMRSTRITTNGDDWQMEADLTIAGTTRPVTFDVEFGGIGELMGKVHAGFSTSGQISRKDYGIDFGPMYNHLLGDVVTFDLDLEFHAPGSTDPDPG